MGGSTNQVLKWGGSGKAVWGDDTCTSTPVGTVLFSTSSTSTFFNSCFGGSWTVLGYLDAVIGSSTVKLYAFKKIS